MTDMIELARGCLCQGCGRHYRVDLLVPDEMWALVRPAGKIGEGGLLCGSCIMLALEVRGDFAAYEIRERSGGLGPLCSATYPPADRGGESANLASALKSKASPQ